MDVVIVNWNAGILLKECIDSIIRHKNNNIGSVIVVDNAYHGHTLAVLDVSPYKFDHSKEFDLIAHQKGNASMYTPGKHIWKVPCPDTYRGLHRGEDAGEQYADYVKEACRVYREERKQNVGAFIIEGGMSIAGVILPPPKYLETCTKHVCCFSAKNIVFTQGKSYNITKAKNVKIDTNIKHGIICRYYCVSIDTF